jgi:hypothetical protein
MAMPVSAPARRLAISYRRLALILLFLGLAAVGPNIFPAAAAGYGSLSTYAKDWLLPAIAVLFIALFWTRRSFPGLARAVLRAIAAGAVATVALEIIRITGFKLGYMPGQLPELMGVQLLNRFALGPDLASNIAGWAYHFWNGASFGIVYVLLFGTRRLWAGVVYGLIVGTVFLFSPVVISLGVGTFGLQFSLGFPITVLLAHAAFGLALGWLACRWLPGERSPLLQALGSGAPQEGAQ